MAEMTISTDYRAMSDAELACVESNLRALLADARVERLRRQGLTDTPEPPRTDAQRCRDLAHVIEDEVRSLEQRLAVCPGAVRLARYHATLAASQLRDAAEEVEARPNPTGRYTEWEC